ncbi:uncharacterized protein VTP21DRAFT_3969 [Calcarisporiella thermophila]|uniref:uncharacterized protein n=1 Tax=Calcarisporiella thermophila TaxID=911321 RepID=UPI003743D513
MFRSSILTRICYVNARSKYQLPSGHLALSIRSISFQSLFGKQTNAVKNDTQRKPILSKNELFYPLSKSPIKDMRERGDIIRQVGLCPVCDAQHRGARNHMKTPAYECSNCGYPTHCCEEHYLQDKLDHEKFCSTLREHNEDEHDLRSGRRMLEFEFPTAQPLDESVNFGNWNLFFYTRGFPGMESERSSRHVSKLLTYPITMASILHESSPYKFGKHLTAEGLKSLAALRTTLHTKQESLGAKQLIPQDTVRIFVVGARAEAQLPMQSYMQLAYLFPGIPFHLHFIGPDALTQGKNPKTVVFNEYLSFTWDNSLYHDYHDHVSSFDPYRDVFFLFSPGVGHPESRNNWKPSVRKLLQTKCAIFITNFSKQDQEEDVRAIEEDQKNEFDWLMHPTENIFRSLKQDIDITDLRKGIYSNWGVCGIRGKKYEVKQV